MKNEYKELFLKLFDKDISDKEYRDFSFESKFDKKLHKLKGKELYNTLNKVLEILQAEDTSHYKNLKNKLKHYKRVHVNSSYVILFYDDIAKKIIFVDYEHHDKVYK